MKNALLGIVGAALLMAAVQGGPAGGNEPPIVVTGGGMANQNDLVWVLSKVKPVNGPERTVLCLYRAKQQGQYFDLEDVRMIDADLRIVDLKAAEHKRAGTDVQAILKQLPQAEQQAILPPQPPPPPR